MKRESNYKYEYTQTNNHNIFFGRIDFITPVKKASNNAKYCVVKLFEFSEQKHYYIFVWDKECDKAISYGTGTVVKINAYVRSFKNVKNGKVEHCLKAFDIVKTFPYYTIFGTIGSEDAHIKRGKGKRAFSLKPDINGDTTVMYGIMDKENKLWSKIKKGKYVQLMGKFNLSDNKQMVTVDVLGVNDEYTNN